MKRLLFDAAPADGNGDKPADVPAPAPAAPPAAETVLTGKKTEAEINLEKELADEKRRHTTTADEKKQREVRISELEDELRRLKEAQAAVPVSKKSRSMFRPLIGADDED